MNNVKTIKYRDKCDFLSFNSNVYWKMQTTSIDMYYYCSAEGFLFELCSLSYTRLRMNIKNVFAAKYANFHNTVIISNRIQCTGCLLSTGTTMWINEFSSFPLKFGLRKGNVDDNKRRTKVKIVAPEILCIGLGIEYTMYNAVQKSSGKGLHSMLFCCWSVSRQLSPLNCLQCFNLLIS